MEKWTVSSEFIAAVRALLIPLAPEREEQLLQLVSDHLRNIAVAQADHAGWLTLALERWRQDGRPSAQLKNLVKRMMLATQSRSEGSAVGKERVMQGKRRGS